MASLHEELLEIDIHVDSSTAVNAVQEEVPTEVIKVSELECGDEVTGGVLAIDAARVMLS